MRPYTRRVMTKERIARAQPTTVHGEHLFVRTFVRLCAPPDTKIPYKCEDYVKKMC